MTYRPDELASMSRIEQNQNMENKLRSGAKTIVSAATAGAGVSLTSKLLPFLNEHVPMDLAVKGISKISPKMGDFLENGLKSGLDLKEGIDFIKTKLQPAKEEIDKKNPSQQLNELGQFSPELQQYVEQLIQEGKSPDHAAAKAMVHPQFTDMTRGIEARVKKKFTEFVRNIYEGKAVGSKAALQDQPIQQQQPGEGQQALMAILQKIQGQRGAK